MIAASTDSISSMKELKAQLTYGLQTSLSYLMKKSLDVVSFSFVGHLGKVYLSATGLALVTANVTGNAILLGLGGAQATLCGQACGAKNNVSLNEVFQRAMVISFVTCIPVSVLWIFSEPVLLACGQEATLAAQAAAFLVWLIPGLFFFSQSLCIQNWLFSQHKMTAPAVVISVVAALHVLWNYLFVIVFDMGYIGTAVSISTSRFVEFLLLLSYIRLSGALNETDFQWSRSCLRHWSPILTLFKGNVLMMSELWASEVLTFLSGTIENAHVEVAAMSIYQSINAFCFQLPNGIQVSACTRVSHLVGSGQAEAARRAASIAGYLSLCITLVVSASLLLFGRQYIQIYTDDEAVIEATMVLMPVLAFYVIGDGTVAALSGALKGIGRQKIGGRIVVFSYYAVAIPISVLLTYHWGGSFNFGMGTLGLCLGTLVGTYTHGLLYYIYLFYICDWNDEVALAKERVRCINISSYTEADGSTEMRSMQTQVTSPSAFEDGGIDRNSFIGRVFGFVAAAFSYVPFVDSQSEEDERRCEYELVQAVTSDLEESGAVLDDEDDYIFA